MAAGTVFYLSDGQKPSDRRSVTAGGYCTVYTSHFDLVAHGLVGWQQSRPRQF